MKPGALVACAVAAAVIAAACVDFGLDRRRFRCEGDPSICGAGWSCAADGYCVEGAAIDAGGEVCGNALDDDDDGDVDCQDVECGAASCDDDNPCTTDTCPLGGVCENVARLDGSCGVGCMCMDGDPFEVICTDGLDNDGDDQVDCLDADCDACTAGLQCCADGGCRASC